MYKYYAHSTQYYLNFAVMWHGNFGLYFIPPELSNVECNQYSSTLMRKMLEHYLLFRINSISYDYKCYFLRVSFFLSFKIPFLSILSDFFWSGIRRLVQTWVRRQRSTPHTLGYSSLRTGSFVVRSRSSDKHSISVGKT